MIAIKDMEMPRSCFCCPFRKSGSLLDDGGGYYCRLQPIGTDGVLAKSQYKINGEFKDKQGCPLVEIGTCKDCKQLGVMNCGYYCKLNHWGKISTESNCGGMGDFYCADFEKRGNENEVN